MVGYCPNCGGAVEHDGNDAECTVCSITWTGGTAGALRTAPYAPGELEELQRRMAERFPPT